MADGWQTEQAGRQTEQADLCRSRPVAAADWRRCEEVVRRHGRTFFLASRALPPHRRRAIHAAYAFCRTVDDLVDRRPAAGPAAAARALDAWAAQLAAPTDPIAVAFAAARARYGVPVGPARELLDGLRMDLTPRRYATWAELRLYCYRVAGTVGLLAAPILGCRDGAALPHAVSLGLAMQLTNILRDVAEDAAAGRLYLPLEDLAAFGCDPGALLAGRPNGRFAELVAFEVARARRLYADGRRGLPALAPAGRLAALAGGELYAKILDRIEEQDYDVFRARASVPTRRKLGALPGVAAAFLRCSLPFAPRPVG